MTVGYTAGAVTAVTDIIRATTANTTTDTVNVVVSTGQVSVGGVSLFTGATELEADGSSAIVVRATVTDTDGQTVAGKSVTFVTSAGSFTTANPVTTDNFGEAEITLQSSANLGAAVITANSEGVAASAVTVQFVAGDAATATLTASPASVALNGQTALLATIVDGNGHAVANQSVTFAIDVNNTSGQLSSTASTTDSDGRATVLYTAGPVAGSDTLSVITANSTTITVVVAASASNAVLGSLSFVEVGGSGSVVADGAASTLLRLTLLDAGSLPIQGASVSITTTAGDLDNVTVGTQSSINVTTDVNGEGEFELVSSANLETASVIASVGGLSQTLAISFVAGPADAANSSITAAPSTLPADGTSTTTVTVVLVDADSHLVADGTSVTLQSTAGTIGTNVQTTSNGRATFTITSPSSAAVGTLNISELSGLTATITFGATADGTPANILTSVANPELSVAGVGQAENTQVSITVLQTDGSPIDETLWGSNNTLRVSFVSKPNGGERISGVNNTGSVSSTTTIDLLTSNGSAQFNVQSGSLPGVVELRIEALDTDGLTLTGVAAIVPQISIASGPAHTIFLTGPITNAINDLNDTSIPDAQRAPGFYRRIAAASVTDQFGNAVANGTTINFGMLDTVIAQNADGVIAGTTNFSSADPQDGDGTSVDFNTTAQVIRNSALRGIEENDRVLIVNAQSEDKSRFVSTVLDANNIDVQTTYAGTSTILNYRIGASMLGGFVSGFNSDGLLTKGTGTTVDGVAQFRITYPTAAINTGVAPLRDTRALPLGSAQVWIVASSNDRKATTVSNEFAWVGIAPASLTGCGCATLALAAGSSTTVTFTLQDANSVPLPFFNVSSNTSAGDFGLTVVFPDNTYTDANGRVRITVTVPVGQPSTETSTLNVTAAGASSSIVVTVQ